MNDGPENKLKRTYDVFSKLITEQGTDKQTYKDLNNFEWHFTLFFRAIEAKKKDKPREDLKSMEDDLTNLRAELEEDELFTEEVKPSYESLESETRNLKRLLK